MEQGRISAFRYMGPTLYEQVLLASDKTLEEQELLEANFVEAMEPLPLGFSHLGQTTESWVYKIEHPTPGQMCSSGEPVIEQNMLVTVSRRMNDVSCINRAVVIHPEFGTILYHGLYDITDPDRFDAFDESDLCWRQRRTHIPKHHTGSTEDVGVVDRQERAELRRLIAKIVPAGRIIQATEIDDRLTVRVAYDILKNTGLFQYRLEFTETGINTITCSGKYCEQTGEFEMCVNAFHATLIHALGDIDFQGTYDYLMHVQRVVSDYYDE